MHEITWSPGCTYDTCEPTASTTPADSCPSTVGTGAGYFPSMKWRSEWHSPAATVRTSTSCGPGEPICTSSMTSAPGICSRTAAFTPATLTRSTAHLPESRLVAAVAAMETMVYRTSGRG